MYRFSVESARKLLGCDKRLQLVLNQAIAIYDFKVLSGHRGMVEQNELYEAGLSTLQYPKSKHNSYPSLAVDIAPYPIDWDDLSRFYYLAGIIKAVSHSHNINLRWGGDWDRDNDFRDQRFNDLVHYEIASSNDKTYKTN